MPRFISLRSMYHFRPDLIRRERDGLGKRFSGYNITCSIMKTRVQISRTHFKNQAQRHTAVISVLGRQRKVDTKELLVSQDGQNCALCIQ